MNFRTYDDLSKHLREDLSWRKRENLTIKTLVVNSIAAKKQAVLRGAIASLYAHWEGYFKVTCKSYFDFVKQRRLPMNELCIPMLSLVFRSRLKRTTDDLSMDSHLDFADWLLKEWDRRAHFPNSEKFFDTSNLSADIFRQSIVSLGLPYLSEYAKVEVTIIDSLRHARNHMAHGSWFHIDETDYMNYYSGITNLMDILCDQVEIAAQNGKFRRSLQQIK